MPTDQKKTDAASVSTLDADWTLTKDVPLKPQVVDKAPADASSPSVSARRRRTPRIGASTTCSSTRGCEA